jgi:eukaryotic-like serine/threonine-protein kinase
MALQAGTRLGPYEVVSRIGAGGMGEVYQARDTRLDRKVALKVLAPELASDADFRARFEREAKAISALNHPHICGLYDIGRERETEYLVLELLEGETLAERITRGPLPLAQVLRFGIEIADALETAHRHGIVHRDLKPGNIMLTAAGTKLLDFGLAKHTVGAAGQALSMLATAPQTGTAQGTIIGTLQYMAPEQVQGAPADARTDIFAFGTILYEMATGRRAFEAKTQASLIAKILETDVPSVSTLASLTPPALDHAVQGCLAKEPGDRWQTAHDVRLQLQWIQAQGSRVASGPHVSTSSARASRWLWGGVAASAGALAATALLLILLWPKPAGRMAPTIRFDLTVSPGIRVEDQDSGAISPDGRHFVFSATVEGRQQLAVRNMASTTLVVLPETEGGYDPFWSPDSRSVGFFHMDGSLKHVSVTGGPVRVLGDASPGGPIPFGGTWHEGTILFGAHKGHIYKVAATGGPPSALDTLPAPPGRKPFTAPRFLPDGRHFLVSVVDDPALYVAALDASGVRKLIEDGSSAVYAAGYLYYDRGTAVFARPFDAQRLEVTGAEVQVTEGTGGVSVSDDGTLVYRAPGSTASRLTWFDRSGRRTGTVGEPGPNNELVLSPRARRAVVVRPDAQGNGDLWNVDLASGIFSRLTTNPADDSDPSWSPDEHALAFKTLRTGRATVFVKDLLSGKEDPLVVFPERVALDQWTPDGRFVIFRTFGQAVYAMALTGDRTPHMLVDTPFTEDEVHVSPNGRWVAFQTNESGRWEVYVAAFPTFTSKRQVSSSGGVQPQWRADGRELFYLAPDGSMMSVQVDAPVAFTASLPMRLFTSNIPPDSGVPQYGVTADGQRFLALERVGGGRSFTFLLNWFGASSNSARLP